MGPLMRLFTLAGRPFAAASLQRKARSEADRPPTAHRIELSALQDLSP